MKKLVASFFVLVFAFCTVTASLATSVKGAYDSTRQFIAELEENEINYSYTGLDNNDYDKVLVEFTGDHTTVTVMFYFNSNEEDCAIRVWDLIVYDEVLDIAVCRAVNTLNQNYRFARFYADTDFTVTASMDVIYHAGDDIGAICYVAMMYLADICDTAYPDLLPFSN
jgi:hypothetical protein